MNTKSGKSMSTFAILLALFCVAYAKAPLAEVAEVTPFAEENYRLPLTVMPESYKIWLQPFLRDADGPQLQFTFKGDCEIVIVPQETTNQIKLHTKRLVHTVTEYWLSTAPLAKQRLTIVDNNDITNIITFQTEQPLTAGTKYTLHFVYTGIMEDDMHGFYKSSYKDKNNNTKWLGSTQFQSYHSRRAFPCFDEPKFKATFQLTLVRHRSMKTVSNTRLTKSEVYAENREWIVDVYEPTPVMSAYIVAFIFSEFNERFDGQFGVLARPEYYDQTEYAHEVGIRLLDYLDKYYDLPYYTLGNDKMHMAAIPDFSAGAMENWGLLTYRERGLLYDPESTTLSSQQYIAAVISHEQTHMWFGDLVTCDWWSYTWLNEGFARYFQYFATAAVEKQFHIDQQFTVDQIQSVMNMDSTNNTNPMSDENTNTPSDLGRMFNSVSYNKGATFLRQIKHIITEEKFQQALREYLKANQYKSTIPSTLFTVFKKYWPTEFAQWADDYFKHFTEQPGYPLITIDMTKVNNGRGFEISQKRFLLKENDGSNASLIYTVPFTYTTNLEKDFADTKPKLFLQKDPIVHNHPTNFSWVVANIQQVGYYRVNYDNASWHNIHHALLSENWGGIHEINRAQIADDVLNLARASIIDYELAFDVLEFLETETHYLPWTAAFNGMNYLAIRLGKDTEDFGRYILRSTEKAYSLLGFEEKVNDTSLDIYARAKVLTWACKFGNGDCIWKAKEHFSKMHQTPVPVNVRAPVYCTALREGTESDFDHMFQMYKTSTVATDQVLYLNAMGCVKDEKLVEKYFNIIISDDVRIQDMSAALAALYSENNENVTPMWKLVTTHFEKLAAAFGGDNDPDFGAVASVISNIASRFTEKEQETELKTFNAANKSKFGSSAATLERAEKNVAENLEWAGRKLEGIRTYLSARSGGSATANAFTALSLVLVAVVAMLLK